MSGYLRQVGSPAFIRKRIKRIALIGDSRCAGAALNLGANYTTGSASYPRVGQGSITPILNIALQGKAVAFNPGEAFTNNNSSISAATSHGAAYQGFALGAVSYDGLMG